MGFFSVPNLVPRLIFRDWIVTDRFLLDQSLLQLDRKGIKEREDSEIGGGGGGVDYSRESIFKNISIKGGQLFEEGD